MPGAPAAVIRMARFPGGGDTTHDSLTRRGPTNYPSTTCRCHGRYRPASDRSQQVRNRRRRSLPVWRRRRKKTIFFCNFFFFRLIREMGFRRTASYRTVHIPSGNDPRTVFHNHFLPCILIVFLNMTNITFTLCTANRRIAFNCVHSPWSSHTSSFYKITLSHPFDYLKSKEL